MTTKINFAVTINDRTVTIELPPDFYDKVAAILGAQSSARYLDPQGQAAAASRQQPLARSEKELVAEKKPSGHSETVAVLAFCLREAGTAEFTAEDMRRAYIRASVRPPKVVAQALRDAKNKYELIEGGSKKGTFRLSSHGERTVLFDLPRPK
jgi:hypothetical protein